MPAPRSVACCVGLAVASMVAGCQTTPVSQGPTPSGVTGPAEVDFKSAQYAAAVEGLRFVDGRVEVDAFGHRDPTRAAEAQTRAQRLVVEGYYVDAIKSYCVAVRWAPDDAPSYVGLGTILEIKGKTDEALAAYQTAVALDPELVEARFHLGLGLWRRGDRDGASEEMYRVIDLDPGNGDAHTQLAIWSYYANDDTTAWEHVLAARAAGRVLPPQFMNLLQERSPNASK